MTLRVTRALLYELSNGKNTCETKLESFYKVYVVKESLSKAPISLSLDESRLAYETNETKLSLICFVTLLFYLHFTSYSYALRFI